VLNYRDFRIRGSKRGGAGGGICNIESLLYSGVLSFLQNKKKKKRTNAKIEKCQILYDERAKPRISRIEERKII